MQEPFIIDNRYLVNGEKNSVTDRATGEESRLEQRLLEVLYLLASTPGQLVTRDKIVANVWNDYGGADEGLTQAISFLRKVFNDRDKKIIETIPKKGYILNAKVDGHDNSESDGKSSVSTKAKSSKGKYVVAIIAALIIAVIIYVFTSSPAKPHNPSDMAPATDAKEQDIKGADVAPDSTRDRNPDIIPDSLRSHK